MTLGGLRQAPRLRRKIYFGFELYFCTQTASIAPSRIRLHSAGPSQPGSACLGEKYTSNPNYISARKPHRLRPHALAYTQLDRRVSQAALASAKNILRIRTIFSAHKSSSPRKPVGGLEG